MLGLLIVLISAIGLFSSLLESSPPAVPQTRFGAAPTNNSTDQSVITKWGTGASVRIFSQDIGVPTRPTGASTVHTSFALEDYGVSRDRALRQVAAGKYDKQIGASAEATPPGDAIEIVHEADKKIIDGETTWPVVLAAKNHFYDVAKEANPEVLIVNTVTGWTAEPTSGRDLQRWGSIKADVLGVDCDGINPVSGAYPNYDGEIKAAVDFVNAHADNGYRYWAVPEFAVVRQASDEGGRRRASWNTEVAEKFQEAGALYVDYFDYNVSAKLSAELTTPIEISAWRALVD